MTVEAAVMAETTMKLHGSPISIVTMRVLTGLYEKGFDFKFCFVDLKSGAHKQEPFLSLNPFGQVPDFEDGDLKMFESRAITAHLAHAYPDKGNQLIQPGKEMAILLVWLEVEAHQFKPATSNLLGEIVCQPMFGMKADSAIVNENVAKLEKVLDVYEARLGKSKYLEGDSYTLADMNHLPTAGILVGTKQIKKLFDIRPHVSAYVADILLRPAWAKVRALTSIPPQ